MDGQLVVIAVAADLGVERAIVIVADGVVGARGQMGTLVPVVDRGMEWIRKVVVAGVGEGGQHEAVEIVLGQSLLHCMCMHCLLLRNSVVVLESAHGGIVDAIAVAIAVKVRVCDCGRGGVIAIAIAIAISFEVGRTTIAIAVDVAGLDGRQSRSSAIADAAGLEAPGGVRVKRHDTSSDSGDYVVDTGSL